MHKIIVELRHPKSAYFLATSQLFEGAAYNGMRAAILLYITGGFLQLSNGEALSLYGTLVAGVMLFGLLGAFIGDLWLDNRRTALLGVSLSAIGCAVLLIPHLYALYIGLGLLALGVGVFKLNLQALFGKAYLQKRTLVFGGFTIMYGFLNLGAVLGVLTIGWLSEINFTYAIILTLVYLGLAFLFLWMGSIASTKEFTQQTRFKYVGSSGVKWIGLAVLFSGLFWTGYEFLSTVNMLEMGPLFEGLTVFEMSFANLEGIISGFVGVVILLVFSVLWSYYYSNSFMKLYSALLILSMAAFAMFFMEVGVFMGLMILIFMAIGEQLISAVVNTLLVKYVNPKYLAIAMAIVLVPMLLFNKLAGLIGELSNELSWETIILYVGIGVLVIAIIAYYFNLKEVQEEKDEYLSEEAQNFLNE